MPKETTNLLIDTLKSPDASEVGFLLKSLNSSGTTSIESTVDTIYEAWQKLPDTIGKLVSLQKLAKIRRNAHIREGFKAAERLMSSEGKDDLPAKVFLAEALLAGVLRSAMGCGSQEMCDDAIDFYLQKDKRWYSPTEIIRMEQLEKELRERSQKLNEALNKYLI